MSTRLFVRSTFFVVAAALATTLLSAAMRGDFVSGGEEEPASKKAADSPATAKPDALSLGGLRGRVLDAVTGKPAAKVLVTIQATKQSLSGRKEERASFETRTDANGEYQFSELPPLAYNVWASADDRTCAALNSISVVDGKISPADELKLVEGSWLEGRVLTWRREPVSHDPKTGERLRVGLSGPSRPRSGASIESCPVDDDGRFRLRVPAGRNFPYVLSPEVWQRTWSKEMYERGIDVDETDGTVPVTFRLLEKESKNPPPPPRPVRDPVKLPPPIAAEWDCAETIRDLGGWYRLDKECHVVEINMVYDDGAGKRYDNAYTGSDEALRIAPAFPRLKRLYLHKGQATDESLACLADLKGLTSFFIWDATAITDAGAHHLAELENLESIHLSNSQTGDAALKALSKLPKLHRISMQQNFITDAGLAHLADMKQLSSLWIGLGKGKITDAGIAHLADLESLEKLDLQKSQITDAGLEHFKKLKKLRRLYLSTSSVTDAGLATLREALPNLTVTK